MEKRDESLIQELLPRDPELAGYWESHLDYERQLGEFKRKLYLTPEQDLQRREIQKLKLAGKDKIMAILERHRTK